MKAIVYRIIGVVLLISSITYFGITLKQYRGIQQKHTEVAEQVSKGDEYTLAQSSSVSDMASSLLGELKTPEELGLTGDQKTVKIKKGTQVLHIPDLDIKVPILEGIDYDTLAIASGHFPGTGKMGSGNYCIAGHSESSHACIFDNLHKVKRGIAVYLYDSKGKKYTYYVTSWQIVQPKDTWVIDDCGDDRCTLITCADRGRTRLVITALKMTPEEHKQYLVSSNIAKQSDIQDSDLELANISLYRYLSSSACSENIYREVIYPKVNISNIRIDKGKGKSKKEVGVFDIRRFR